MPLLPREDCVFPDDLLTNEQGLTKVESRWWVLHTRPRAEKALARRFAKTCEPFFLPLYEKQWCSRGRRQRSYLPLFPGYLFLFGDSPARLRALETNLVAQVLPVAEQDRLESELQRVYRLILSGNPLTPEEQLQPGRWVTIREGALAGMEGKIIRRGGTLKLLVEIEMLHRGVSVELEDWMVEPKAAQTRGFGKHERATAEAVLASAR